MNGKLKASLATGVKINFCGTLKYTEEKRKSFFSKME